MCWRNAFATACSSLAVLALAGCGGGGGGPRLPVLTALQLSRLAGDVAAGRNCGAPLLGAAIGAVNRGEVPAPLQEPLLAAANRIAARCSRAAAQTLADELRP